ncbi:MAG: hypothetical protein J5486_01385 [Bacteroidaceae bacterium]|nr:hypothetical protein [Bacteroidaceae bacterium]
MGLLILIAMLASCSSGQSDAEEQANALLSEARTALAAKQFSRARSSILTLRKDCPTAISARRAAILTLDSIELLEAQDSVGLYEPQLTAARQLLTTLEDNPNGHADPAYIAQRIIVYNMEQHFDELSAKARFFKRKLQIDINSN